MTETLHDIYNQRIAAGEIHEDQAQIALLGLFENLREALQDAPKESTGRSLFRRKKAAPPPAQKGIYVWGGVGRGKSMIMDLFFDHVDIAGKRRVHFHAFMQEVHAALHKVRKSGADDPLKTVAEDMTRDLRLLCFDEMQITDITDAMLVGRLFDLLFASGVTIVTTSNRVPDDLYKDGLQRERFVPFIELIKDRLTVFELVSDTDYRQNRLTGQRVYFSPAGAEARAAIDEVWNDLAAGTHDPLVLTVKGRAVELPSYHNGMARASFWELCGKMLGPGDYLAIAEAVRLLVLEDIPQLGRNNFNEAKRFVTLIDALYEAKVRLIASAAAEPEMLYVEGTGSFEFERTASRLREMQDKDWGLS